MPGEAVATTRDAVAEAYDESVSDAGEPSADVAEPAEPSGAAAEVASDTSATTAPDLRARDAQGRFAKADGKPAPEKPEASPASPATAGAQAVGTLAPAQAAPPAAPAVPELKPPQDWNPRAREKWASLPREVQEEAIRLHIETRKTLQEAAESRKFRDTFQQIVAPHESLIRANGIEPMQAVANLLQREATLFTAPPHVRAALLAQGIRYYLGTEEAAIEMLAKALHGPPEPPPQMVQQRTQPVDIDGSVQKAIDKRLKAAREAKAQADLESFGATHEFFNIAGPHMAGLLESGLAKSLEEAYAAVCSMHPETKAVFKQREDAKAAATAQATTQRRNAAASGLKSEPAGVTTNPKGKTTRDTVAQEFDRLSRT